MLDIIVVEDNEEIGKLLCDFLRKDNYTVSLASSGEKALDLYNRYGANLVVLDIMLPGKVDGFAVCSKIREDSNTHILIASAKTDKESKLRGLEIGADDYIEKPFDSKELVARVKAVLRRTKQSAPAAETTGEKIVRYPDLLINLTDYSVTYNGETVEMPPKEIELLYFLASQPNHAFTREQLLDKIWGYDYVGDTRTVDVHIKRLREKINDHEQWKISTIWGIGYKFETKIDKQ